MAATFDPVIDQSRDFIQDSVRFLRRCQKPPTGVFVMGLAGYLVTLVFIPINSAILGSG
ncbi:hypothetical protein ACHQM5_000237 [Ranunculus cassubicifolius]